MQQVNTKSTGFIDPNKLHSIDVLDRFCKLHLWAIRMPRKNINVFGKRNYKMVNGFNKGEYHIRKI